jgi:hypothetical protein
MAQALKATMMNAEPMPQRRRTRAADFRPVRCHRSRQNGGNAQNGYKNGYNRHIESKVVMFKQLI